MARPPKRFGAKWSWARPQKYAAHSSAAVISIRPCRWQYDGFHCHGCFWNRSQNVTARNGSPQGGSASPLLRRVRKHWRVLRRESNSGPPASGQRGGCRAGGGGGGGQERREPIHSVAGHASDCLIVGGQPGV